MTPSSLRFPWPRSSEPGGLAMWLVVRDPVWLAVVRQQVERWRKRRSQRLRLVPCEKFAQLHADAIHLVEVSDENLVGVGEWLRSRPAGIWPVATALARSSFHEPSERNAAAALLYEAGAKLVLTSPRQASELSDLLDQTIAAAARQSVDPLSELPLRCWDPAWQRGQ